MNASQQAEEHRISGRGHTIPATGNGYNERLKSFLAGAKAG